MGGLARIARMYGSIVINGERFLWDYVAEEAVPEADMPPRSDRRRASERKRAEELSAALLAHRTPD